MNETLHVFLSFFLPSFFFLLHPTSSLSLSLSPAIYLSSFSPFLPACLFFFFFFPSFLSTLLAYLLPYFPRPSLVYSRRLRANFFFFLVPFLRRHAGVSNISPNSFHHPFPLRERILIFFLESRISPNVGSSLPLFFSFGCARCYFIRLGASSSPSLSTPCVAAITHL